MSDFGHNGGPPIDDYEPRPGDWLALSRRVREHPVVGCGKPVKPDDPWKGAWSRFEAWFDLLCLAQYRPSKINNKGEVMTLEVGQLMGALPFLAARWNWTVKTVRGFLATLEHERMITGTATETEKTGSQEGRQSSNKCRVITICNYSRYQSLQDAITEYVGQAKRQAEGRQRAGDGQAEGSNLTSKTLQQDSILSDAAAPDEAKPRKRAKVVYTPEFEAFWQAYPDTTNNSKVQAFTEFRALSADDRVAATAALDAYRSYCRANRDYRCLHAERFLKHRRFEAYAAPPAGAKAAGAAWWQKPDVVAQMTPDRWRKGIAKHANGIWPWKELGPPPGTPECKVPRDVISDMRLDEIYDHNGMRKASAPDVDWMRKHHDD